ncbi:MAG: S-layer homology domain-containing protein [Anaerovoracaceae bacterium]|jgi:hypothetical protein
MRQYTRKGLSFLVAIAMVLALIPATVFADEGGGVVDDQPVLKKVNCSLSKVAVEAVDNENKQVIIKVPYGFSGSIDYANCTFEYYTNYGNVFPAAGTNFSLKKGESKEVTFEYGETGEESASTTYTFKVIEREYKAPVFESSSELSITGSVGTAGITIPASIFNTKYTENDGGPISQIEFTSATVNNGITLKLNGEGISGPIPFTDIQNSKLKAYASAPVPATAFQFSVFHQKEGVQNIVGENAVLKITATLNTNISDVTGNVNQKTNYPLSSALTSIKGKAATELTEIKFTALPDSNVGKLYTDLNRGTLVKAGDNFSWADGGKVVFYADTASSSARTGIIGYEAYDDSGNVYTGSIKITVAAIDTAVRFSVDQDKTLKFEKSGFNTASSNATGKGLDYITFDSVPTSSQGTLYYNYKSASNTGTKISSGSTKYYYSGSDDKLITNITFVPKDNYSGTININYKGRSTNGENFTGKITIEVKSTGGDISNLTYSMKKGSKLTFKASDFNSKFKSASGSNLSYVKFKSASETNWTLYYDYKSSSDTGSKISTSTKYYRSATGSNKALDKVTFVPKNSYSGTIYLDYTGYDSNDDEYTGRVKITVGDSDEKSDADIGLITYNIKEDKTQTLSAATMNTKFKDAAGGEALYYATFKQPKDGTLYYDYKSASEVGTKVSEGTKYYRTASGSRKLINNITYVPKSGYNGTVYIDYTGFDENDDEYSGQIKILVGSGNDSGLATLSYSIKSNETLTGLATAIINGFKKVDGNNLDYLTFTLPPSNVGILYSNYNSSNRTGTAATATTKYHRSGTPSLNTVVFVPKPNYVGSFDLKYRAFNEDGDHYDGIIRITVTDGTVSKYFTDLPASYSWAATEIDSLYSKGIIKGVSTNSYGPGANIKRGDFMLMLYRAFNLKSNASSYDFADVPKNSYYYDAIKTGKALGIAQGSNNRFNPEANLTRQDAMALVYRTIEKAGKKLPQGTSADMTQFSDRSLVSSYAYSAVATLVKAEIIKGTADTGGKFRLNPKAQMTRAEMAVVLYRILELQ